MKLQLAILTVLLSNVVYGNDQFTVNRTLQWNDTSYFYYSDDNIQHPALYFTGASLDFNNNALPIWGESFTVSSSGTPQIQILNPVYEPIARQDLVIFDKKSGKNNSQEIEPAWFFSKARTQQLLDISFIPIRKNSRTGQYEKLVSFTLSVNIIPSAVASGFRSDDTHTYAANSALASGTWYKIGVKNTGVYKIDKAFLESLGISTGSLNANTLGIFGNGGGMLPESNAKANYDDLAENAIYRSGLDDGSFDYGDYILFYAKGPTEWSYNATAGIYTHSKHLYSDESYYFISTDKGSGKEIITQGNNDTPAYETSDYDYLLAFDIDKVNLINSGRIWYDSPMDAYNPSRNYTAVIPSVNTLESGHVRTSLAAKSATFTTTISITGSGITLSETFGTTAVSTEGNFADTALLSASFTPASDNINLLTSFIGSGTDLGWVNYIEISARSKLNYANQQLQFRDIRGVGAGEFTRYKITGPSDLLIWDVTNVNNVLNQAYLYDSSIGNNFTLPSDTLKQFIAFYPADAFQPDQITNAGIVTNQDLHNISRTPDYIIVSYPSFIGEARRLAAWHHDVDNYDTMVVNIFQVYNEFSSGTQDITAIRNFMRMFYDRAAGVESEMPKYLLLFGDASFDYKNLMFAAADNTNFIPTYESFESNRQTATFPTDDYFVCLDSEEGYDMSSNLYKLDIGVGRFTVKTVEESAGVVNKIMHYKSPETFGNWRNIMCFVADDEDSDIHIQNSNDISNYIDTNYPVYNLNKIYMDAYQQIPGAGGERYPDVNIALNNQIFTGAFIINWAGHGNEQNWAQERILSVDDINSWTNYDKLPLFITATCSFSRFDNPDKTSAGELILLNPQGGGVGLVSTVRIVYASANYALNLALNSNLFVPIDGNMPALGEALRKGKNIMMGSDAVNTRKFFLFGDPGLVLNYPRYNVKTTTVNGIDISVADTLKALSKVTIEGVVTDMSGDTMTGFNGTVYPTVYDKPINITTLVNDPGSYAYSFKLQKNAIYKGKASVTNGTFRYTFVVPKDISYDFGNGKLSYYANNETEDAAGYETNVLVGGSADSIVPDNDGPDIDVFMNDETFVFGGLTNEDPLLYIKLHDENGMNTVGSGIGHDITSTLDENQQSEVKLNDYYEAELDSFQAGSVSYPLRDIAPGLHTITVSAWDVYDNPGEGYTEFVVAESADLALDHVLNYPNPFTTNTSFWFEHNRPGDVLDVKVEIFTVSGKLIKTILQQVQTDGYRVSDIDWDGLDNYGDQIGKGVYVYKLSVKAESDNSKANEFQKLVILR